MCLRLPLLLLMLLGLLLRLSLSLILIFAAPRENIESKIRGALRVGISGDACVARGCQYGVCCED